MASSYLSSNDAVGKLTSDDNAALVTTRHFSTNDEREAREEQGVKNLCDLPDELLVQVLSQVPVEARVGLRTISKKWHNIILDLGYHIEPNFLDDFWGAHYSSNYHVKLNPFIDDFADGARCNELSIHTGRLDKWNFQKLLERPSELITSPPVSMIDMRFRDRGGWSNQGDFVFMSLRTATPACKRSEGIRISDLLDILEKMGASTTIDTWVLLISLVVTSRESS